jgi:hypothetical protein
MAVRIDSDIFLGTHTWNDPVAPGITAVTTPLQDPSILLDPAYGCHVDHEGFDLNQIEQEYYKAHGVSLAHDPTLYKDGAGIAGTHAIIQPWCEQSKRSNYDLVVDHSHFVYRYPIKGEAAMQITQYAEKRPELLRLISPEFKCGLDLCIDIFYQQRVQTIVHIEWDFDNFEDMKYTSMYVRKLCMELDWDAIIPAILMYNKIVKEHKIDAFTAANTRSQLLFGRNSYILIPTL